MLITGLWLSFTTIIIILIYIDLNVLSKKAHAMSIKEAIFYSCFWIGLALTFNCGVLVFLGKEKALEFLTGYLIEESLSLDNLFAFIMIFSYFHIEPIYQPRILKWGIIGAIILRGIMIFIGISLIVAFAWVIYVFGALLIVTGIKMYFKTDEKIEPEKNILIRLFKRFFPIYLKIENQDFFVRLSNIWYATPLFIALLAIEFSDVVFAMDSIPAIFAITTDAFIVYTSNIFAILGLRSLFFLLVSFIPKFKYLKHGISIVLIYTGTKMLIHHFYKIPVEVSLGIIAMIFIGSITLSVLLTPNKK
ncbi:MAG: TerC family protein [Candidatus Hydrogenedentota bacterium]